MSSVRIGLAATLAVLFGALNLAGANAQLLDAIRADNGDRVRTVLANGGDPNSMDSNQVSALMYAALYASPRVIEQLLRAGADFKYRDPNGVTALVLAAHSYESAKILIGAGADVNAKSKIGVTPFMTAAAYPGNTALLRLMLEKGADTKASALGATALTLAVLTGDADNTALLLESAADPNTAGPGGLSALHLAVMRGDRRMVQLLLDAGAKVTARTSNGEDILERYGFWNDPALVRMLLERGINPAIKDARGHNAVLFAAASDTVTPEVFALLLKDAPPSDARTAYGDDALQMAARRGDERISKMLGGTIPPSEAPIFRDVQSGPAQIRTAALRGLDLLATTGPSVVKQRGCFSCHHQGLPSLAGWYARRAGIDAAKIAETNRTLVSAVLQGSAILMQQGVAPAGEAATIAWQLIGLKSDGQAANAFTDIAANYIAATQLPEGNWPDRWGRPPLEYSPVSATAIAVRALDLYGFPSRHQEFTARIASAVAWLAKTRPDASEEKSMRLMGLVWGRASRAVIDEAANQLASTQRFDGGWAQLPALQSDAYATGQALVALRESGHFQTTSPAFMKGIKYLLGTQEADGSWHVRGRSLPVQPLFESGFPHGRDQWISAAGTSWAAMALSLALPF
jgi:ankyrin repeat protein